MSDTGADRMVRIAALGDVHYGASSAGTIRARVGAIHDHADVLLVAGDLTRLGHAGEAQVLADDLHDLGMPVACVLGNHDYHSGEQELVSACLAAAGVTVLEGTSITLHAGGLTLGIAGVKGFGGGFRGACGTEFGEPQMKGFVGYSRARAHALQQQLLELDADVRVALTHYAPVDGTMGAERREIFPFLGSYLLGDAIDRGGADLAFHGHAHHGSPSATTPAGVVVRNVALPVLDGAPYLLAHVTVDDDGPVRVTCQRASGRSHARPLP